ncbi:MAG: hypothetical protein JSR63_12000 [Proteobacteria bacterium]|nr:hypothetical protein [Pseudomonadota bacterium]
MFKGLDRLLEQNQGRFASWIMRNTLLALFLAPCMFIMAALVAHLLGYSIGENPLLRIPRNRLIILVLMAPFYETLILAALVWVIRKFRANDQITVLAATIIFGLLHTSGAPLRFFSGAAAFFVFSCAYVSWQKRSFSRGYWAAALPHFLFNSAVMAPFLLVTQFTVHPS